MHMTRSVKNPSDRTINRLIIGSILVLAVGIPLIGVLYVLDQYRDPGPTMAERAIESAEKAVRETPNSVSARFALAELYATQGRTQDAIAQYDEILKASPGQAAVLIGRGQAYATIGQTDAAAADFQAVIDAKKDSEMASTDRQLATAYYDLGSLELQRGDAKKASDLLTQAVAINTTDADTLYMLGKALIATGDTKTAIEAIRLAVALVPTGWCEPYAELSAAYAAAKDTAGTAYANGMGAMCAGRTDEARTALTDATKGAYALDAYVGLGLLNEGAGDYDAAASAYRSALEKDPQNFAATTGLGRVSAGEPAATSPVDSPAPGASGGN
jgi:tetratricopeptide (TPR) repeat protein